MKLVPLTQGKTALVSDADYATVAPFKWHADRTVDGYWYARHSFKVGDKVRVVKMHRMLAGFPPFDIDHKNGNGLDNRRSNLRPATDAQNQANRRLNANSTSGYKGVSRFRNRWAAYLRLAGQKFHLGYFDSPEIAATAYGLTALAAYGDFACLQ